MNARIAGCVCVASLSLMGGGCAAQDAPSGLDDLSQFIFDRVEPATGLELSSQESEIRDAARKLQAEFAAQAITIEAPFTGTLSDLPEASVADLEGVADRAADVALAQGFALANVARCTLQQEVNLVSSDLAREVHPGVYDLYEKTFDVDASGFREGTETSLGWRTTYKIAPPPVGSAYQANLRVIGRRVAGDDSVGDILMTRVHLLEPAVFDGDGGSFDLDFQTEIYVDNRDGTLSHFYGMWRRMVLGPVSSSDEIFISQTLSGFVDFENRVEAACADGTIPR
jgi:hypothetical protein